MRAILFTFFVLMISSAGAMTHQELTARMPAKDCGGRSVYWKLKKGFIQYCRDSQNETQKIVIRGNILEGDEPRIQSAILELERGARQAKNTVLTSDNALGGLVKEHNALAEAVKKICKDVPAGSGRKCETQMIGRCASACNAFHSGIRTVAGEDARNCFHSATIDGKKIEGGEVPLITGTMIARKSCVDLLRRHAVFNTKRLTCVKPEIMIAAKCRFVSEIDPMLTSDQKAKEGDSGKDQYVERLLKAQLGQQ